MSILKLCMFRIKRSIYYLALFIFVICSQSYVTFIQPARKQSRDKREQYFKSALITFAVIAVLLCKILNGI